MSHRAKDRIFDGLSNRFSDKIYGTRKGQVRLEVLRRHLWSQLPLAAPGLHLLDIGAGAGHLGALLAEAGHHLTLVEPSADMRDLIPATFATRGVSAAEHTVLEHTLESLPLNDVALDGVFVHAVLEWVRNPQEQLARVCQHVSSGAWLSLAFYNVDGLIWRQLMRGNFKSLRKDQLFGDGRGLTPINPLRLADVEAWLAASGLRVESVAGIRVFSDFMDRKPAETLPLNELIDMEWEMATRLPYWPLARYLHVIARRP